MTTTAVCSTFRRLAFETWDMLQSARSAQYQPGEETITDLNVLELKKRHPREVVTQTFSKPEEGKTGADWEWWLTGPSSRWFGCRVQAKILKLDTNEFEHLHYKSTKSASYQSDRLIQSALGSKVPLVPLYCLYSHWSTTLRGLFFCGTFGLTLDSFGCSLMSAFDVRQLRLGGNVCDLPSVIGHAYPWHCLVCCSGHGGADLPDRARRFWQEAIRSREMSPGASQIDEGGLDADEIAGLLETYQNISLVEEPPAHVSQLISGELSQAPDQDLGGIVVVREVEEAAA